MPKQKAMNEYFAKLMSGEEPGLFFNYDNAFIGVGDGSDEHDPEHTDLQGANKKRRPMRPGYPQRSDDELTYRARFEEEHANFAWNEIALFNAYTNGTMANRLVISEGIKGEEIWDAFLIIEVGESSE